MPTVLKTGTYRFFLERAGGFSRVELNTIAKLVHEHRESFLERRHEFFGR